MSQTTHQKYRNLINRSRAAQLWGGPGAGNLVTMRRVQFLADLLAEVTNTLETVVEAPPEVASGDVRPPV